MAFVACTVCTCTCTCMKWLFTTLHHGRCCFFFFERWMKHRLHGIWRSPFWSRCLITTEYINVYMYNKEFYLYSSSTVNSMNECDILRQGPQHKDFRTTANLEWRFWLVNGQPFEQNVDEFPWNDDLDWPLSFCSWSQIFVLWW